MEIRLPHISRICSRKLLLFIPSLLHQRWQNMLMNGLLQGGKISLAKQYWYRKCNRKAVQRVLFTALGAWLVFGLVWAGSAIGQMIVLHKAGQGGSKEFRSYRNSALVAIAGMILLGAAFAMT